MKSVAIMIGLLFLLTSCKRQEKGEEYIAEKEFFNDGSSGSGPGFLYQLTEKKVYNHQKKEFTVKLPAGFDQQNTAWGLLYFPGLGKRSTRPDLFYLLHYFDSSSVQLIVDENGNSDFTDDSTYNMQAGKWFEFEVANNRDDDARVRYQVLFRNDIRDSFYAKLQKSMAIKPLTVLPYRYMLFDKVKNFRKVLLPDSNTITLCDADVNGFFNDKTDRVIAGDIQKGGSVYNNPMKSRKVEKGIEIPFRNNTYRLLKVDPYGKGISLAALNIIADSIEVLPGFQYTDETGNKREFQYVSPKEFIIFYVWGVWCIGCHVQAPAFAALMSKYQERADFYTFNTGDTKEQIQEYLNTKKYPFKPCRLSKAEVGILNVESFPTYLVIGKKKQVFLRTSSVEELKAFLEK